MDNSRDRFDFNACLTLVTVPRNVVEKYNYNNDWIFCKEAKFHFKSWLNFNYVAMETAQLNQTPKISNLVLSTYILPIPGTKGWTAWM